MKIAVRGAYIVENANKVTENGYVIINDGKVSDITTRLPEGAFEILGGENDIVLPGLINTHTHACMTLFRGIADDLSLEEWLHKYMFPLEAKHVSSEFVYFGTLLACLEMIKTGTTGFCDGYFFMDEAGRAATEAGMRAWLGEVTSIYPTPSIKEPSESFEKVEAFIRNWTDNDMVKPTVFPHAVYTTDKDTLIKSYELSMKYGIVLQTHLNETRTEVKDCMDKHGLTPIGLINSLGCLSSGNVLAAHCVAVDKDDIDILSKTKTSVAHCAKSNKKLASGIAPVDKMLKAGVNVTIGTDGCASNNSLDIFSEMSTAAKLHKVDNMDPTVLGAHDVLEMASLKAAGALKFEGGGRIEKGCPADVIVLDGDAPNLVPLYNPISHAIYAAHGLNVKDSVIAGRVVMKDYQCLSLDEKAIIKECRRLKEKIAAGL